MAIKSTKVNGYAGLRNDVTPERFNANDLLEAVNVDIDETGKLSRRGGRTLAVAGAAHSLWCGGSEAYFVQGGMLNQLMPDLSVRPIVAVSGTRVAYARLFANTYWTDGRQSGVIRNGRNRQWGVTPPPLFQALPIGGELLAGTYLYTMVYVRENGRESGASPIGLISVGDAGGISFPSLPVSSDPLVTQKRIYLTARDGDTPYLAATLLNSLTTASITGTPQAILPVRTQGMGAAPRGQIVGLYKGRSYVASGSYLWYSEPFEYELFRLRDGFINLGSTVRTFAPVSDGLFVGSETETWFFQGDDPATFKPVHVAPYGTVLGTEREVRNDLVTQDGVQGVAVMWLSQQGICLGTTGGGLQNMTSGRFAIPTATSGASLFKERNGTPQFLTTLSK